MVVVVVTLIVMVMGMASNELKVANCMVEGEEDPRHMAAMMTVTVMASNELVVTDCMVEEEEDSL